MRATITRSSPVVRTARTMQLEGIFDMPPSERSEQTWQVSLPVEERPWNVGLVVGPSGTGKSTLVRDLFPDALVDGHEWPADKSVVDGFPADMGIRDVVALLSSVGFSSPPAWLRPFGVLSNGEQFRATVARALAEARDGLVVLDEFTSVVDRTVAQIGSAAIAKTVRARGSQLIAATCHYDVEEWLQPDWVYQPHLGEFTWRSVQPRPTIELRVERCHTEAWRLFGPHHYLDDALNRAATCFVGFWQDHPVVFLAVLPFPHAQLKNAYRAHRLVTLPDYQGVGIGNAFCDYLSGVYKAAGRRLYVTTAHPARVGTLARNPLWRMGRKPSMTSANDKNKSMGKGHASTRFTASFEYVGPPQNDSPLLAELNAPSARLAAKMKR